MSRYKEEYHFCQDLRICPTCRRNKLFKKEKLCPECLAYFALKNNERYAKNGRKNKESFKESRRKIHKDRIDNKLCTRCGKKIYGYKKKCESCLEKDRIAQMRYRMRKSEVSNG